MPLSVLLVGLVTVTTGCTSNAFTRMGLAAPITKQAQVTLAMWQGSWIAAWAVGIVVWGGILWTQGYDSSDPSKLMKIGALVRVSVRRIKIAMASGCPS